MSSKVEFTPDKSGIKSLAGFSFQIKVFCNLASKLEKDKQIEFESVDDIAISHPFISETLDDINSIFLNSDYEAIQVKHTTLNNDLVDNVLMNWIQIEASAVSVSKYILITDRNYENEDLLRKIDIDDFIKRVMESDKKKNANITKVKEIFSPKTNADRKKLIETIINKKYDFRPINIDDEIHINFENIFHRIANEVVYFQRLDEFLSLITSKVLKAVNSGQSYILTYRDYELIVDNIIHNFSETVSLPSFIDFKNVNPIDLKETSIANSREYKQLEYCKLSENLMRNHLLHEQYYRKIRSNYIELCMESKCGDIENTAYENFESVKDDLQDKDEDSPKNRLKETVRESNSYAANEQIREGACIYLTSGNVDSEMQISWKDE